MKPRDLFGGASRAPARGSGGRGWEDLLEILHYRYRRERRAKVFKTYPRFVPHRSLPSGEVIGSMREKGEPDYAGILYGIARFFWVEGKEFHGPRFEYKGVRDHQADHLDEELGDGAGAYVVVRSVDTGQAWLIPWAALAPLWRAWQARHRRGERAAPGSASLDAVGLDALAIYTAPIGEFDYLSALAQDMEASRVRA